MSLQDDSTAASGNLSAVRLILASKSPRRIEMMRRHGFEPEICPADVEENIPPLHGMEETVMYLAFKKAKAAEAAFLNEKAQSCLTRKETASDCGSASDRCLLRKVDKPAIIIAADTIVYMDEIMGKPMDFDDGFHMLSKLRGKCHFVATGVALLDAGASRAKVFCDVTKVFFKDYSDEELTAYLKTDEAYDKAGGYAIQGYFERYIEKIEGSYDNVVGFPWARILQELKHLAEGWPVNA